MLITAAVYWPVGQYGFVNCDDPDYVSANPHIQQGLTPAGVAWAFQAVVASNWHPVTCLSLMLDCQLFGKGAGAHHLVNLLFHVADALLLFLVWRRMTGEVWPSALVAALFAWHPLHVESVAWISERKDVLSAFFGLLAIWAYSRHAQGRSGVEPSSPRFAAPGSREAKAGSGGPAPGLRRWTRDYWLALFFFALGLMSKPMLVTWPFVLLLLDFWPLGRMARLRPATAWRAGNEEAGIQPIGAAKRSKDDSTPWRDGAKRRQFNQLLLEKLPFFALAAAASAITFLVQRAGGATELLSQLSISDRAGNALVSCVRYLGKMVWPEHLAFFYPYPGSWIVHSEAWTAWQVTGSAMLLTVITVAAVRQARRRPFLIVGWLWFLGTLAPVIGLVQVGSQSMADRYTYIPLIGVFVMIAWGGKELGGRQPRAKFIRGAVMTAALAACLAVTGRQLRYWRDSETLCRHAIEVTTNNYKAHFNLGLALIDEGKKDEGFRQLYETVAIAPGFSGRKELAEVLMLQGKTQEAIDQYRQLLQYNPNHLEALNNLAWLLAANEDPKVRNGADAVQFAERACDLTHYDKTVYIGTLAAAYAEAGQFADAIKMGERAIASATALGETNLLEKNRRLLELYRAGQPYHEPAKL
ncbi:MAG: tetratricopeptide repeat protein [Verrucomicrobiota bacterium]